MSLNFYTIYYQNGKTIVSTTKMKSILLHKITAILILYT